MSVKMRQLVEKEIVTEVAASLLRAGFYISVDNGDEEPTPATHNLGRILEALFLTDEDYLIVYTHDNLTRKGWVRLIYGNDGWDVINDYSVSLDSYIGEAGTPVQKIIDKYCD
jgi:hypothetical protein